MIGQILDDRYELKEFIGKGGMALVYRALDHRTGHDVAVKILRPEFQNDEEFLNRFDREAEAASKMSHHNIVNLLDVGKQDDCRYLVMEYVNGRTLKDVIDEQAPLRPELAAQISIRILSALQHAHNNKIIHRDIKPQNILVHSEGHIKVADFGIARMAGKNTITDQDSVMGSAHYISPEQARGESVSYTTDLYSVGVVLYEMLTGKVPFDGDSPVTVAMMHINAKAVPLHEINPAVPAAYEKIVEKAMEKKPELRYQTALDMARDLQHALQDPTGTWLDDISDMPIKEFESEEKTPRIQIKEKILSRLRRNWYNYLLLVIVVLTVIFVTAYGIVRIYDSISNSKQVPYVIGETEEEAKKLIIRNGLEYNILARVKNDTEPAGTVIKQSPEYDTMLRKGETVSILISTGSDPQMLPSFVMKTEAEARAIAEKYGYTISILREKVLSDESYGTILSQDPPYGTLTPQGTTVYLYQSGGNITVPNLCGLLSEDAVNQALSLGIQVENIFIKDFPGQDESKYDKVFSQRFYDNNGKDYQPDEHVTRDIMLELYRYVNPALYTE